MTGHPKDPTNSTSPEADADAEFERVLRNLVNTPHKPHVKTPVTESAKEKDKGGG